MKISKLLLHFCFISFCLPLNSQKAPIKWGDVDKKDLQMQEYEEDPSAEALVLCDYGNLLWDFNVPSHRMQFERHRRIKFLKRSALDKYGDVILSYYTHNDLERIKNLRAQVINPDGKAYKLGNKDIFEVQVNEYWTQLKFSFPQLQEGSVAEFKYTLESDRILSPLEWYYQEEIPVLWSEINLEIPEIYEYVFLTQGSEHDIQESESSVRFVPFSSNVITRGTIGAPPSSQTVKGTTKMNFTRYRFVMNDVPAMKEESYITSMENYYAKSKLQLKAIHPPNDISYSIMESWEKVARELWEHSDFGQQLKAGRHGQNLVEEAFGGNKPSPENAKENIETLFRYVTTQITWNGQYGFLTSKSLSETLRKKQGTGADLNLLLLNGLQSLGLNAKPALISTRDHGRTFEIYPFIDQFNDVIVYVDLGDEKLFLDAKDPNLPLGAVSLEALNYEAWIADPTAPFWADIPLPETGQTWLLNAKCDEQGRISGNVQASFKGYHAVKNREAGNRMDLQAFLLRFFEEGANTKYNNVKLEAKEKPNEPLLLFYDYEQTGAATSAGDLIYLNPWNFSLLNENPLKQETRNYPVEIPFSRSDKFILNLDLPEGYVVEELPESMRFNMPDKGASFTYLANDRGNQIQFILDLKIDRLYYNVEEYEVIRQFFIQMQKKVGEKVVLRKV